MRSRRGFTLIELLITIALVAILSGAVLYTSVSGNLKKGRDGRRKADLESIRSALELYKSDVGSYPSAPLGSQIVNGTDVYMQTVPTDPSPPRVYSYLLTPSGYSLCADLETVVGVNDYCVTNP